MWLAFLTPKLTRVGDYWFGGGVGPSAPLKSRVTLAYAHLTVASCPVDLVEVGKADDDIGRGSLRCWPAYFGFPSQLERGLTANSDGIIERKLAASPAYDETIAVGCQY